MSAPFAITTAQVRFNTVEAYVRLWADTEHCRGSYVAMVPTIRQSADEVACDIAGWTRGTLAVAVEAAENHVGRSPLRPAPARDAWKARVTELVVQRFIDHEAARAAARSLAG